MIEKEPKQSAESGHLFRADYRRHFKEMRDSSVATSSAQRRPFSNAHGCAQVRAPTDGTALG